MSTQKNNESLKSKTVKGILWGGISTGVQQLLNLIFGIYLARKLSAEDYGLVGILTIFTLIASTIQESGFISSLANKKDVEYKDYNAVFWTTILISLGLYTLLFFAAPFISAFFGIPELTKLSRYLFSSFVFGSFGIAHSAYLFKNLKVKERSLATTLSVLISGIVGIILVYYNFSYWSIVFQSVAYSFSFSAICFFLSDFRPSLKVDFSPIKGMWKFSNKILIANIVNHINNNLLTFYLGKITTKATVGYYTQANKWSGMTQGIIANMSHGFAQPLLSNLNNDNEKQNRVFLKLLNFICFTTFPALALLCIISEEFITITISSKWLPSVPLLQVLCINAAFAPIINFYGNYFLSKGASNIYMRHIVAFGLIQLLIIFCLHRLDIIYIVWGMSIFTVFWTFIWQISIAKHSGIKYLYLGKTIIKYVITVIVGGLIAYYSGHYFINIFASSLIKIVVFSAIYLSILYIFKSAILHEIVTYIKKKYVTR
ncbi:lipopolysaccharide biosynthesis protein [Sphingobacterium sp. SRCM116780]|uniref:lipopolysaccharide biosynthesis protein n=1 Tax=Sphingobacterium sp. SRCM116780 TaxID=2907623 RepID=UPI001F304F3C|nr:lipopolysaccharide biosynthesis protein [Sphingobacterium sp. SRCM116780]UIR55910.1 lipopolysaccharide biosynthesis protein [Sphingobacterium sp. SRCM116780]